MLATLSSEIRGNYIFHDRNLKLELLCEYTSKVCYRITELFCKFSNYHRRINVTLPFLHMQTRRVEKKLANHSNCNVRSVYFVLTVIFKTRRFT